MNELLPCPFCGGEAHMSASSDGYGVQCWNRRCIDMQMEGIPTEAEAIEAWNTRAERTCKMVVDNHHRVDKVTTSWGCVCSACGSFHQYTHGEGWAYCPNCGAKVVGE